jgi:uncharacterized protein (DUF2141 family)
LPESFVDGVPDAMSIVNDESVSPRPDRQGRFRRAWKESHGGWLLAFAALICVIGMLMIYLAPPKQNGPPPVDLAAVPAAEAEPVLPKDAILIQVSTDRLNETSPIRIAIYDSKEAFGDPDRAIIKDSLVPTDGFVVWEIKSSFLPDEFCIAAYHDLDNNGQLNRALFNAPVEPYGFSNNARSLVGPPTFEQTLVQKPDDPAVIQVRVY